MGVMCLVTFILGIYCGLKTDEWQREAEEELRQKERGKND